MLPRAVELEIDEACVCYIMAREIAYEYERSLQPMSILDALKHALNEWISKNPNNRYDSLTGEELSAVLARAQELELGDGEPQPVAHLLEHAEEIR
jgi:hypothetical protein